MPVDIKIEIALEGYVNYDRRYLKVLVGPNTSCRNNELVVL